MTLIEMTGINKYFPPEITALENVDFEAEPGEIHCLLGENGAGKTTLMNILYGIYKADTGTILFDGAEVEINSPRDAINLKIGMVHQHFRLVKRHTVAENIALGLKCNNSLFPLPEVRTLIKQVSERYGLSVDPDAYIWELSVGEQQRVEIIKVLCRDIKVLILDEPTSILTPQETETLFKALQLMKQEGIAIIFITHKLDEVMTFSDKVTVLRKGRKVDTVDTGSVDKRGLAKLMVGRDVLFRVEKSEACPVEPVLEIEELHALNDSGLRALNGLSLSLCGGEILGVAGVSGNGQRELVEIITGLRKKTGGEVKIGGADVSGYKPGKIAEIGVAHIPEDRIHKGSVPDMRVQDNLMLRDYKQYSKGFLLGSDAMRSQSTEMVREYNIDTPSLDTPIKLLSGGNIQKVILARELHGSPSLIIASHPTYGLDVGATEQIRTTLLGQRDKGAGVLLISEDLDEILDLSDRVVVIYEGRIMGEVTPETDVSEIGLLMSGGSL
jgi:general nucleoside transport system ATP-binding protein